MFAFQTFSLQEFPTGIFHCQIYKISGPSLLSNRDVNVDLSFCLVQGETRPQPHDTPNLPPKQDEVTRNNRRRTEDGNTMCLAAELVS